MTTLINQDFDVEVEDQETAFKQAEFYTEQGYEVTKPRSYDNGKTWTFTVSSEDGQPIFKLHDFGPRGVSEQPPEAHAIITYAN